MPGTRRSARRGRLTTLPRPALAAGALLVWWILLPTNAAAAPTCTFDGPTATVTIAVGGGESATIVRQGDAIALDGAPCETATVTNTDSIVVNGTGTPASVTIDLGGGPFAPGATTEGDGGASEIEFTIDLPAGSPTLRVAGSGGNDTIVLGNGGINLNAEEAVGDADVTITGTPAIAIDGNAGQDALSVAGGAGTGSASAGSLNGGDGDDRLAGATGGSAFDGGAGVDAIDYGAADGVDVDLGGVASHTGGGTDTLAAIENALGSPGNDVLTGTTDANALSGRAGDDRIDGGGGDDALDGGAGRDTVRFRSTTETGVEVDLRDGTATGAGNDTLAGFENVMGTKKADTIDGDDARNKLAGGSGRDELFAHGGSDLVTGGPGSDRLFGQDGADVLLGRSGRDQLDGGRGEDACRGGPDPDSFVDCEKIVLG